MKLKLIKETTTITEDSLESIKEWLSHTPFGSDENNKGMSYYELASMALELLNNLKIENYQRENLSEKIKRIRNPNNYTVEEVCDKIFIDVSNRVNEFAKSNIVKVNLPCDLNFWYENKDEIIQKFKEREGLRILFDGNDKLEVMWLK